MTTTPTTAPSTAKKNTQKLQRAIVDGLEDVKAQNIAVFDTEHLSALFERVIIASGTSNRQTKALAVSVRDAVRKAGFPKPRIEGEGNGEWIIVDCAQAVVHIMQPNFRQYYHLEELWGEKPVRLKLGDIKPIAPAKSAAVEIKEKEPSSLRRSNAAKKGVAEAFPSKAQIKKNQAAAAKTPAKKVAAKKSSAAKAQAVEVAAAAEAVPEKRAPAAKKAAKVVVVKAPKKVAESTKADEAKKPSKKAAVKKVATKSAVKSATKRKA
jgi:ribosome-associated protein